MAGERKRKAGYTPDAHGPDQAHARLRTSSAPQRAAAPDAAAAMLRLQQTIGNRAVYRLAAEAVVQTKLQVGPAGDHFEREADQVANDVMRNLATTVALDAGEATVSRWVDEVPVGLEGGPVGAETEAAIQRHQGQGARLPDLLRRSMEGALGADFGGIRVHDGPSADALNRSMQAKAFTVGSDIFFARGQYQPEGTPGQRLLAHELTHTIQQGAARSLAADVRDRSDGAP